MNAIHEALETSEYHLERDEYARAIYWLLYAVLMALIRQPKTGDTTHD